MSERRFIPPHGNYRELLSYRKAEVVYDLTVGFCRRFLRQGDRTTGQMVQAARSGKGNVRETRSNHLKASPDTTYKTYRTYPLPPAPPCRKPPRPLRYSLGMEEPPFAFAEPDYPLGPLTRYRVGGPARWALLPRTMEEARAAYAWMAAQRTGGAPMRRLVLGGGSNVLISDRGIDGAVLVTTALDGIEALGNDRYRVECGAELGDLVQDVMLPNNYDGVGGLTGIPGTVGGAIYMNAGTVNGTTCQWLESVEVAGDGGSRTVTMDASCYGYRGQSFCPPGSLILQGVFRFRAAKADQRAVYEHYMQRRREKQPQGYCCGSVFKNPPGDHAGRLLEACGLKGTRRGGAVISPVHANFIMNEGGAAFDDILGLIRLCQTTVKQQCGVDLECEVIVLD